jgi:hypothetical protein
VIRLFWAPVVAFLIVPSFAVALVRTSAWLRARKGVGPPFSERLLRSPGHGLSEKIEDVNDDINTYLAMAGSIPLLFYCFHLLILGSNNGKVSDLQIWIVGGAFSIFIIYKLLTLIRQRRDLRTGLMGELAAGEELNRLMLDGYHVYHDFPADHRFNIDHILVGPPGVFAVETKARSKPGTRGGKTEYEVIYEGERLKFPSWVTRAPLDQAKNQADWLRKWLKGAVGEEVNVHPILTIPGWYINRKSRPEVPVLNPKEIRAHLKGKKDRVLSEVVITRICHQLEQKCRDVDLG